MGRARHCREPALAWLSAAWPCLNAVDLRLRRIAGRLSEASFARVAQLLTEELQQKDLPMPAQDFAVVIDTLLTGLLIQRALTPNLVRDDLIIAAFEALA